MTSEKNMSDVGERLLHVLRQEEEAIKSREDLIAFIDLLIEAYDAKDLQQTTLPGYLETMAMSVGDLRHLCRNTGVPYPLRPGWFWIGRQLYAAFL